jgi:hypothetical protein
MEALPRYAVHDEYAVQEMILRYKSASPQERIELPLRANIDETVLLVVITEQGENRN